MTQNDDDLIKSKLISSLPKCINDRLFRRFILSNLRQIINTLIFMAEVFPKESFTSLSSRC